MATDSEVVTELERDGYCPTCCALENEACVSPAGVPIRDHKRRHPYAPKEPD